MRATGGLPKLLLYHLDCDEIVRRARQHVAERRENVHRDPLRFLRDEAIDLHSGQMYATLGQPWDELCRRVDTLLLESLPKIPGDPHLLSHDRFPVSL